MAYHFDDKLVVAVSSRALFDLEAENEVFEEKGIDEYYKYLLDNEKTSLSKGTGFRLINNLLKINEHFDENEKKVEVIILSKNNAATSLQIINTIKEYKLDITRSGWTSGNSKSEYLKAFDVDLFLSADEADVANATKSGIAAARILPSIAGGIQNKSEHSSEQVRIAFDGDAVLFSGESERIYKNKGLKKFQEHEIKNKDNPLGEGPFANLLRTLASLQEKFSGKDFSPIRTALVTARSAPAHERVIKTLNQWGVRVDEAFFLGGSEKTKILQAFGADIFFDDQDIHLNKSSSVVPSAKVPSVEE